MQQRLPSRLDPPIGFAHRGARAHAPENTLEAFLLAQRLGATGLETDAWITADGVVVLDHDGVVGGGLRRRPIYELSRRQLPDHLPSVAELIDACDRRLHLSIDVKDPTALSALVAQCREVDIDVESRLWLCHHDWNMVASWRRLTEARLVDSCRFSKMSEGPERRALALREAGVDAINMHHSDWSGGLVTLFHRFDLYALGWDMQQEHVLRECLRMGLDGVYSDWTDRMMEAIGLEAG
ncbi:MAG: glycerophosphodiester phosphodiesterase [Ilumatobacteraceae bacterium]